MKYLLFLLRGKNPAHELVHYLELPNDSNLNLHVSADIFDGCPEGFEPKSITFQTVTADVRRS